MSRYASFLPKCWFKGVKIDFSLLLCSGGKEGYVRFYDPLLRIVAWFEDLDAGPIAGIAFSAAPPSKLAGAELADTINRFIAPDFYVSTTDSKLISVQVSLCSLTLGCQY